MLNFIAYIVAGLGAGIVTGLAGLSAAVVITPILVGFCGWQSYDAVTVALASDVLASLYSAYTYYKNGNIDVKRGALVTTTAFVGTVIGSYCGYLFSQAQPDGLGYISMLTTIFLGIKFLVRPVTGGRNAADSLTAGGYKEKDNTGHAMRLRHWLGLRIHRQRRRHPDVDRFYRTVGI